MASKFLANLPCNGAFTGDITCGSAISVPVIVCDYNTEPPGMHASES
jgi:hypothetical protein